MIETLNEAANWWWQAGVFTLVIWLVLRANSRLSAATRHAVWCVALLAIVGRAIWIFIPQPAPAVEAMVVEQAAPTPVLTATPIAEPVPVPVVHLDVAVPAIPAVRPSVTIPLQGDRAAIALLGVWFLISLILLLRILASWRAIRRLANESTAAPTVWQQRLANLEEQTRSRRQAELRLSAHIATPIAVGLFRPRIYIPAAFQNALSEEEFDQIALHEIAHLRRRDDWSNLIQKICEALFFYQPAVLWIVRRLELEREIACDDWVVTTTGKTRPYAECLTRMIELAAWNRSSLLATGAAQRKSQLFRRIEMMLDPSRNRNRSSKLTLIAITIFLVGIAMEGFRLHAFPFFSQIDGDVADQAPVAPTMPVAPEPPATPETPVTPESAMAPEAPISPESPASPEAPPAPVPERHGRSHMTWNVNSRYLDMDIEGDVQFSDDDRDVKSISPGGSVAIGEGRFVSSRRYEVRADTNGTLTRSYFVGGVRQELDSEGRAWLAGLLPETIREMGIDAPARVDRILHKSGPRGVLAEIGLIHSDGSKRIYLQELFARATLDRNQLEDAMRITRAIGSDGDKSRLLIALAPVYFRGGLRATLLDAATSIASDGDRRRVLSSFIQQDPNNTETLTGVAKSAGGISSDGDKTQVLVDLASQYRNHEDMTQAWFKTAGGISSDGDRRRALSAMLAQPALRKDVIVRVLRTAQQISSDGDKQTILRESTVHYSEDEAVRRAFFDATNSLNSAGDRAKVLSAIGARAGLGGATLGEIFRSAKSIPADGDKTTVLIQLCGLVNSERPVSDSFFDAANSISSDGDHARLLLALLSRRNLGSDVVVAAVQSAVKINSDGDKARVLLQAADYSTDPAIVAAVRKAVDSIHSDGDYRRVMSVLSKRAVM